MARLVLKDNVTSGGALAPGQTLRLGGFTVKPTMTSWIIENILHVSSGLAEQLDPIEVSSLNELLDRIAALGVATDYDQIGLKPDQREINFPPVTHQIVVVEEQCDDSSSFLRTNYVRIPELSEPDTRLREDIAQTLNLVRQRARTIGQHPGARTAKLGNSSAPRSQIGSGFGSKSTHPPSHK